MILRIASGWPARLAAFALGAVLVGTQPPYSIWPLLLVLPVLFLLWSQARNGRDAFLIGWFAGTAYFGLGLFWIAEAFLVQPELFAWMIPIAMPLLAGGLALFWGGGFWLAQRLAPQSCASAPLIFATAWMAVEALRGVVFTGFPWALLGYAWVEVPPIQSAAIFGIHGVTLLTLLAGSLLGATLTHRNRAIRVVYGAIALTTIASMWAYGTARLSTELQSNTEAPLIGIVQPNVAQAEKWHPQLRQQHLRDLLAATQTLSAQGADVVVWPEAATPYAIAELPELREEIAARLRPGGYLLTGALRVEGRGTAKPMAFNSLLAISADGTLAGYYDKEHLVPFGEFVPFDSALTRIGLRALVTLPGGFAHGEQISRRLALPDLPPFASMICYEAIFPHEIVGRGEDIEWLLHLTNDGWFGNSAGPHQHLAQARVRAIERGIPALRAANTGISAFISADGEILRELGLNTGGTLLAPLPAARSPTTYHQFEELIFLVMLIAIFLISIIMMMVRKNVGRHS